MATRKIIWTQKANFERKEILDYWFRRNKSKVYSTKLNKLFIENLKFLSDNPLAGRKTQTENIRVKIIRDYLLFYEIQTNELIVLTIWEGRRNDELLKIK